MEEDTVEEDTVEEDAAEEDAAEEDTVEEDAAEEDTNEVYWDPAECFKAKPPIYGNLQVAHNSSSCNTILWNKYQILVYEKLNFEVPIKVFFPDYQIHCLLINNTYSLCLDTNGRLYRTALRITSAEKRSIKSIHQTIDQGIKACITFSQDLSLSLQFDESYYIIVHKINTEYHEIKRVALIAADLEESTKEKCLLAHKKLDQTLAASLQKIFPMKKLDEDCNFIVMSFDKLTIYGCLFDIKMADSQMQLVKLYSCPAEICTIQIIEADLLIPLIMGSVIRLKLEDLTIKKSKPQVTYMNSAIHKFAILDDINTFVYTDGLKMWKAENVFSEQISFSQFFVNQVYDFTIDDYTIICTTFSKLIYKIPIDADDIWLKNEAEFSRAEVLLNNSECVSQIFKEVKRAKSLSTYLNVEGAFLAAMSLPRRPDIMEQVVLSEINIYNTFLEVMNRNDEDLFLTEDASAYFETNAYLLHVLVKINDKVQARLYEIITYILQNSQTKLHVTVSNEHKTLKRVSLSDSQMTCVIPVQLGDSSELNVNLRLITIIPGTYNRKELIWLDLFKKDIKLTSEHFITDNPKRSLISLKRPYEDLHTSILNMATAQYGQQFNFKDIDKEADSYSTYLRLPRTTIADNFANYLSYTKSVFMLKALSSEDFLTSKSPIHFNVGKETVEVLLENYGFSNPQLKITCKNAKIAIHIRNFFSDIVYKENECKSGQEFISNSFYTTVENLQTEVKDCVTSGDFKRFKPLMEEFDKNVISALPF